MGLPHGAATGKRAAEGQETEQEPEVRCMPDPQPPKVGGPASSAAVEPTAPSAVSATLLCSGGKRGQPGRLAAPDHTARGRLRAPSPETCSPRPSVPLAWPPPLHGWLRGHPAGLRLSQGARTRPSSGRASTALLRPALHPLF